jgi:hypothetical protein
MKYRIQVYIDSPDKQGWYFIKGPSEPSGKKEYIPYEYDDHNEAYRMAKMCYPDGDFRVTDINGNHTPTSWIFKN